MKKKPDGAGHQWSTPAVVTTIEFASPDAMLEWSASQNGALAERADKLPPDEDQPASKADK